MLISVIVPVFNADKYLNKCIDSILQQSVKDFELLLIDDGSTDKSSAICDSYLLRDERVKVHHQRNSGPSNARNKGINMAIGNWIVFVDSDDYVTSTYLSDFLRADLDPKCLLIQGMFVYINGQCCKSKPLVSFASSCLKLFNRNLIMSNHIQFPEDITCGEDTIFNLRYCKYIDTIKELDAYNYYYTHTALSDSLSNSHSCDAIYNSILAFRDLLKESYIIEEPFYFSFVSFRIKTLSNLLLKKIYQDKIDQNSIFFLQLLFPTKKDVIEYFEINYKTDICVRLLLIHKFYHLSDLLLSTMYKIRSRKK